MLVSSTTEGSSRKEGSKSPRLGLGMFAQALHFVEHDFSSPQDVSTDLAGQLVAAVHNNLATGGTGKEPRRTFRPSPCRRLVGAGHFKGAAAVDAMTGGHAAGLHVRHGEGNDVAVHERHHPAQRTGKQKMTGAPVHAVGKGKRSNDGRRGLGNDGRGRHAAHRLSLRPRIRPWEFPGGTARHTSTP